MPDVLSIVKSLFTHVPGRSTTEEVTFVCPVCGDATGNRSVNVRSLKTNCWRCGNTPGMSGNFFSWLRRLGYTVDKDLGSATVSITEAERLLNEIDTGGRIIPHNVDVKLPSGFTRLSDDPGSGYARLIEKMAKRKGLTLDDMVSAGVGFTKESMLWEPYAIFPVFEYDSVVYYQGRTYVDEPGKGTKRFPSRKECRYGASYWVYNIDKIRNEKPSLVVVVEAILNVISLQKVCPEVVPVCVFKHAISEVQLQKILSFDCVKEVCVLYDSDSTTNAWIEAGSRVSNRVAVSVAKMPVPEGRKKSDPNDNPELAIEAINDRIPYTAAGELGSLISKL